MEARFFWYCCQTRFYWEHITSAQIQANIQNVSAERYANLFLPCPDIYEQQRIISFLDRETTTIDDLIAKARRAIELLREHGNSLIAAAVTGKIDVRHEARTEVAV